MVKLAINGATTMPYSLEEDITAAAAAGFAGIELWWDKVKDCLETKAPEYVRLLLDRSGLEAVAICPFLVSPFRNQEALRKDFELAVRVAEEIECGMLVVCPDFQPASLSKEEALQRHADELAWYAERAAAAGIRLAIEPIGGHTLVPGPLEGLALIQRAGSPANVGVLFDTFHNLRSGIGNDQLEQIPLDKLYIVHINDSPDLPLNELKDADRVYPGHGIIPLQEVIGLLRRRGYSGHLSVEIFRPDYWERPIADNVRDAYDYTEKLLKG